MSINKSEQNEVVSILTYIIKLTGTLVESQWVGGESVMLDLLRCTLEMVTIEWNAKCHHLPPQVYLTLYLTTKLLKEPLYPTSSCNKRQLMIHKRGSIFIVDYLTDFFRMVIQIEQIKRVQSTDIVPYT